MRSLIRGFFVAVWFAAGISFLSAMGGILTLSGLPLAALLFSAVAVMVTVIVTAAWPFGWWRFAGALLVVIGVAASLVVFSMWVFGDPDIAKAGILVFAAALASGAVPVFTKSKHVLTFLIPLFITLAAAIGALIVPWSIRGTTSEIAGTSGRPWQLIDSLGSGLVPDPTDYTERIDLEVRSLPSPQVFSAERFGIGFRDSKEAGYGG